MATKAICIVNVIKLQKPLPNATLTAVGEAPLTSAASATTTTAMATKMKASGNQRSAQAVKPMAVRTIKPSCCRGLGEDAAVVVVVIISPPAGPPSQIGLRPFGVTDSFYVESESRRLR